MELPVDYTKLTPQKRREVRVEYTKRQEGRCYYCDEDLKKAPPARITEKVIRWEFFPKNFLDYPVHLQHNHATGMTEGAVHAYCNAVLWQYEGK